VWEWGGLEALLWGKIAVMDMKEAVHFPIE
jgi:hypothetical protein